MKNYFATLLLSLVAAGCDGLYEVRGWVVPGEGIESSLITCSDMPPKPEVVVRGAKIQLYRSDGKELVDTWAVDLPGVEFSVSEIGWSPTGSMTYQLVVKAPGFQPLRKTVSFRGPGHIFVFVKLAPGHRSASGASSSTEDGGI